MIRRYFLPNRQLTEDVEEYIDAWESLARPMMEMTNTRLQGFDPIVTLRSKEDGEIVQLPIWFLQAFNNNLKQKQEDKEEV